MKVGEHRRGPFGPKCWVLAPNFKIHGTLDGCKVLSFWKPKTSGWSYRVKMPKTQFPGLEPTSSWFRPRCQPRTPAEWLRHPEVIPRGCWGLSWAGAWRARQRPTHSLPTVARLSWNQLNSHLLDLNICRYWTDLYEKGPGVLKTVCGYEL